MNNQKCFSIITLSLIIILVFASMNFMLYGSYLIIISFLLMVIFLNKKFQINNIGLLLIGLSLCYIFFVIVTSRKLELRILAAPCAYLVAFNINFFDRKINVSKTLLIIAFSMSFHSLCSLVYTIVEKGFDNFSTGISYDFWSRESATATGIATYYYFLITTIPIMFFRTKVITKVLHISIFTISMIHNLLIGGRTCIVLFLVSIILSILLILIFWKKRTAIKYIMTIIIVFCLFTIIYINNFFNIQDLFESSYFFRRFFSSNSYEQIGNTSRWERKLIYIRNLFTYPFGGNHLKNDLGIGYAHDIWLDTFDDAGVITMFLMLIYTISSVFRFFKFSKLSTESLITKITFYIFPIIIMLAFFVEPILSGAPIVFFMYCFMDGLISSKLKFLRKEKMIK